MPIDPATVRWDAPAPTPQAINPATVKWDAPAQQETLGLGDILRAVPGAGPALDIGAPIGAGIRRGEPVQGFRRGAASSLASAIHAGSDFLDQQVLAPTRTLYGYDPLGFDALAEQSLGAESEINKDRQAAAARIGGQVGLGDLAANPSAALEQAAAHITNVGAESAPAMALALATRNPELASSLLGGVTGAQEYTDLRGQGVSRAEAARAGALTGAVEAAGESFGLPSVLGRLGKGSAARAVLSEGLQEGPVQILQQNIEDQATGKETPITQQLADALDAMIVGGAMGGGGHVATNIGDIVGQLTGAEPSATAAPVQPQRAPVPTAAPAAPVVPANPAGAAPENTGDLDAMLDELLSKQAATQVQTAPAPRETQTPAPAPQPGTMNLTDVQAAMERARAAGEAARNAAPPVPTAPLAPVASRETPEPPPLDTAASEVETPAQPQAAAVDPPGITPELRERIDSDTVLASNKKRAERAATLDQDAFLAAERADRENVRERATKTASEASEQRQVVDADMDRFRKENARWITKNGALRKDTPTEVRALASDLGARAKRVRHSEETARFDLQQTANASDASLRDTYGRLRERMGLQKQAPTPELPHTGLESIGAIVDRVRSVVSDSLRAGNAKAKAVLAPAQPWLSKMASKAGLDIDGFSHVLDASAIRHIRNEHGSDAERRRGQIPVTDADFEALPEVVHSPDKVVFGTRNRRGHSQIGYLKRMPDGQWLYFEEARNGRRELAATSLRKYPATMDAESVIKTISAPDPNAQSDGGNGLIVEDGPTTSNSEPEQAPPERTPEATEDGFPTAEGIEVDENVPPDAGIEVEQVAPEDAPPEARELLDNQRAAAGERELAEQQRQESAQQGEADAGRLGLRDAIGGALGDVPVEFLRDEDGLPPEIRRRLPATNNRRGRRAGLFDPESGRVFVFTDAVRTPADAAWTAAHEIAGHKGFRALVNDRAGVKVGGRTPTEALNKATDMALQNPTVAALADAIGGQRKSTNRRTMAEEALAELSAATRTGNWDRIADRYGVKVPAAQRTGVKAALARFVERLKRILNALRGKGNPEFSDAQVHQLVADAWTMARDGVRGAGEALESVRSGDRDAEYMRAVEQGDMAKAQQIIDEAAADAGYSVDSNHRMDHRAPNHEDDVNLADVRGSDLVPDDYWTHPEWYQSGPSERAAFEKLRSLFRSMDARRAAGRDPGMAAITVYRAVPKATRESRIRNGDWVSPSEAYARDEGASIPGGFRIIRQIVSANNLWWDGNSSAELGYDDGSAYAYRDTKNNRKRLDAVTRDENGEVIPPSRRFNPRSANILESVVTPRDAERRAAGRRAEAQTTLGGPTAGGAIGWNFDTHKWEGNEGTLRRARAQLDDKMIAWRDVQGSIAEALGNTIPDAQNVYRLENLMHGRVKEGIDTLEEERIVPLVQAMDKAGVTPTQLDAYLYARHAKERNAEIAKINPGMPDGGSGMTDAEADAFLAHADTARLEPLARRADALVRQTRRRLLANGLITQEQFDAMEAQYQHYVPLRGKAVRENEFDNTSHGGGRGLDTRPSPVKNALGRGAGNRAENILGEIIGDAQRSIIAAEKARVGRAVMRIVLANPNPALWSVEPVQTERKLNAAGEVYEAVVHDWSDPSIIAVRHRGQIYAVQINFQPLAQALNMVGVDQLSGLTRAAGVLNRYFSAVLTRYNPAFIPVNATRDALFGLTGLSVEHGEMAALQAAMYYPRAIRAAWKEARRLPATTEADRYAREFAEDGGKTGYVHMPSVEDLARKIGNGRLGSYNPHGIARAGRAVADMVGAMNDSVENALRLSAYATLRKRGMSREAAAAYAKEMTVNFNRKGYAGSKLNAWLLFYNASIQGAKRTATLAKRPKTWAYLGALAAAQVAAVMYGMGQEDDDGTPIWDKVPDYVKQRNLVFTWLDDDGEQHLLTIPMPYGFNIMPYLAGRVSESIMHREDRPQDSGYAIAADVVSAGVQSFSPVPLDDGALGLVPTAVRIPLSIQVNRNDWGRKIRQENPFGKFDVPRSTIGRPDTLEIFKLVSKGLNRIGGGDDYTPPPMSAFDLAPEDIEYIMDKLGGGAGKFVVDVATLGQMVAGDAPVTSRDIPIINRFTKTVDDKAAQQALFYDRRESIERSLDKLRDTFERDGERAALAMIRATPALRGAGFKRYKTSRDGHVAGQVIVSDGRPQVIAINSTAVFGQYKKASKAVSGQNEAIRNAYNAAPMTLIPNAKRDTSIRAHAQTRAEAQRAFNAAWNRDVVAGGGDE